MNCCKDLCNSYKVFSKRVKYSNGVCFCSLCNKNFKLSDIEKFKCFCCHSKIRTTPKSKKNRIVKRIGS